MKIIILFLMCFSVLSYGASDGSLRASSTYMNPNKLLLPSPFPVYILENNGVVNQPYPGTVPASLPTDNSYTGMPGCYIACYSHFKGVYPVSPTIYVMGQIRVKGQYVARICQPDGYLNKDISGADSFKRLCSQKISTCRNIECWAGGDTGGWFGIQ